MLHHVILPPIAPPAEPFHCLVLHGLGDSHAGWMDAAPAFALPEIGWVFCDAPDEYYDGYSWFAIQPGPVIDESDVVRSRGVLVELIDHLLERLAIPADRLFLMGFSQGCLMVLDAALRGRHRFAGVVGISGWAAFVNEYPAKLAPAAKDQHILWTHGLRDDMVPIAPVRDQALRLHNLGLDVDWREYAKGHHADRQEIADIRDWMRERMHEHRAPHNALQQR